MPWYTVKGYGRETGCRRQRRYRGWNEDDAINAASADGTIVETIVRDPVGLMTESQFYYAYALGLSFPGDIDVDEMRDLLSRHLGKDGTSPQWLISYASELGADVTMYTGIRDLYSRIANVLVQTSDTALVTWFMYHVCRHVMEYTWDNPRQSGISETELHLVAEELARDPRVMKSIRRYAGSGACLLRFGRWREDGQTVYGGSVDTIAFKAVLSRLNITRLDKGNVASAPATSNHRREPATEKQKAYAYALGIRFAPDISADEIWSLIDQAVQMEQRDPLKVLTDLAVRHRIVRITYWKHGESVATARLVEPYEWVGKVTTSMLGTATMTVVESSYVRCWQIDPPPADGEHWRHFRTDCIKSAKDGGGAFTPRIAVTLGDGTIRPLEAGELPNTSSER